MAWRSKTTMKKITVRKKIPADERAYLRRRVAELEKIAEECDRTNRLLLESEERFRLFFEGAPAYCYMISPKGIILNANRAALRALGYKKEELVGQAVRKIYAPESLKKIKGLLAKWKKTGKLRDEKLVIISKKGEKRAVLLSSSAVRGADKKILHSISIQRDVTERNRLEERTNHLNAVLWAIKGVGQVIAREKDQAGLLKGVCDALVRTRSYKNAWIALLDDDGNLLRWAESGLGRKFSLLANKLKDGDYPSCFRRALNRPGITIIRDPFSECPECPLSCGYKGRKGISTRLEYGNERYGVLTASIPGHITTDDDEKSLFAEVAGDIAFALHNMRMVQARQRAEERLAELSKFPSENPYPVLRIDKDGTVRYANQASSPVLKAWGCRVGRKLPGRWFRLTIDALNSGARREVEMTCDDRLLLLTFAPVQEGDYINVYGIDITERQKAKEAEQLKKLAESLINFQEEERRRISRELHDQIGQLLAAVKLHLRMLTRDHPGLEESVLEGLEKATGLLDRAQEDARRIYVRLRPDILDDFGLSAAIENEVAILTELSGLDITFAPRKLPVRIDPLKELTLYRVAQEALTNIIRHSRATAVRIRIKQSTGKIVLSISDNGKGFAQEKKIGNLGILGMHERLDSVGGVLKIETKPEGGTVLEAEVPL